jgi:hypothetical protein
MLVDQRRLIEANGKGNGITHHIAHNGQVHDLHPRLCSDTRCRQWGSDLIIQQADSYLREKQDAHFINPSSSQLDPKKRHPVYAIMGFTLMILSALIVTGTIVVLFRNVHFP